MFVKANILLYTLTVFVVCLKSCQSCQDPVEDEYTGKLALPTQFPFAIRLYSKVKNANLSFCTAAIISHRKLLTAAHCCQSKALRFVVWGDLDQTDFVNMRNKHKYKMYFVKKIFIHPSFERSPAKLVYDLCIVELEKPLKADDGHQAIKISYETMTKKNCTALGWGSTLGHEVQHRLYYKKAIGYRCNLRFGNSSKYWFVCLEPHSLCPGDSGGPLVCDGKLYGIASFFIGHGVNANPKCEEGVVDYYAELSTEREFIEKYSSSRSLEPSVFFYGILALLVFKFQLYIK